MTAASWSDYWMSSRSEGWSSAVAIPTTAVGTSFASRLTVRRRSGGCEPFRSRSRTSSCRLSTTKSARTCMRCSIALPKSTIPAAGRSRPTDRSPHLAPLTSRTVAEATLILYQTEWCPFSSAVREVLTELGLDFVARQVQPWPKDRADLKAAAGTDLIPVLEVEDGRQFRGTREIFAHLREREPSKYATAQRRRFAAHRDARESD